MGVPPARPALPGTKDSADLDLGQLLKDCACCTLPWSKFSHRKCDSFSEASVCAELVRVTGTQALTWGSPQAERGCGGNSALLLVLPAGL